MINQDDLMKYTIRVLHNGIWGPTGLVVNTRKEAKKFEKWGYYHYEKCRIVKATKGNLERYIKSKSSKKFAKI
jgi:hypothetical protein